MGRKVLVTGGAGFIGSNFVRLLARDPTVDLIRILDKLTYAGSLDNLEDVLGNPKIEFVRGDIANYDDARPAMEGIDWVVNFAAESHVDRSLRNPAEFVRTNIEGVRVLLEIARETKPERFLQISTDEVYGSIAEGCVDETAQLHPSSPYSASKASADMLCNAYLTTFSVPVIIARSANNYGPYQYPEKLIPRFVSLALKGEKLPLYGDGRNIRDWLYVEDNCRALLLILKKGKVGEIYNIGAGELHQNIEIARKILEILGKPEDMITFVADRPGHDRRYCVNWDKIRALGWEPQADFEKQFRNTVKW
ncbi:MAG TPA: dTDP-glucose 4,6-dehydratase, partial [candidate division Zixibacteria bacterium]|nr:dTDP-glucose 4,6-dehydratase [candidate division Zixibacteria bacterium]